MSPGKEAALFEAFPMLYRGADEGPQKNLMCFGFECGDGWYELIFELSRQICELSPMTKAFQVKEKYGGLRFYIGGGLDPIFDIIDEFEHCSYKICEECGEPGRTVRSGTWIKTMCGKHAEEQGYM